MFPLRLKQLRENKGLSQDGLGKLLNTTQQTINNYEKGKREPSQDMLQKIADIFKVSTDYLLGRTDDPTPPQAKQEKPNFEEYVLSASGLGEATIRVAELDSLYGMDSNTFTSLSRLAYKKFGLPGAKGSPKAAGGIKTPGTGALDKDD